MTFAAAALVAARVAATLGWTPPVFWAATPADLRAALGLDLTPPAAAPPDLARLMEAFPDEPAR